MSVHRYSDLGKPERFPKPKPVRPNIWIEWSYRIQYQQTKSFAFLYTNNEKSEKKIKKKIDLQYH